MAAKPLLIGTGLSGMVGSRFTELFKNDFNFVNLDLTTNIDITNKAQVESALAEHSSSTVLHLAAFTDVSKAFEQNGDKSGSVYQINTIGTSNIAQACQKHNHYLIHISTDFVFDGKKSTPYTETDQPKPIEWYGQTKYWAEQEVEKSNCQQVIIRTAFPFRAKFPPKKDLVRNILDKLKTNSLYPMFTDQIITPTFIDDLCQALKVVISKKPTGIYHITNNTSLSPYDLAQKIAQVFQIKTDIKQGSFKEYLRQDPRPRQQYLKISNLKAKQDMDITMPTINSALSNLKDQLQ